MKVAAFSKAEVMSGTAGFSLSNTVVFRFYDPNKGNYAENDEVYEKYAGGYIALISDIDFSESGNSKIRYEDYIPEADALCDRIFREFLRGRDIIFQCEDGCRISGAFAAAVIDVFRKFRDDIEGERAEGYNQYVYSKVFDMLEKLKKEEYTIL